MNNLISDGRREVEPRPRCALLERARRGADPIYTLHPTEFETITAAIDEVTGGAGHPAQTLLGVTGLALPGLLIEVEATASVA